MGISLPTASVSWLLQPAAHGVIATGCRGDMGGTQRHRLQRGKVGRKEGKEGLESGSRILWEGGSGFREPPALETVVVAPLRLCGVNLHLSVCSNSTGLVEGGSKPGIPEGQLGGC